MRELIIALLDDSHGVNKRAWKILNDIMLDDTSLHDIFVAVKANENRWYLPENWNE